MKDESLLCLRHGAIRLPAFLPDATTGFVRAVDAADLMQAGVQALVMNVFHLMQKPGSSTIQTLGGLHAMTGWNRPIVTDSGGFQIYSLIRQYPGRGSLTDRGMSFQPEHGRRRFHLTPEKSVRLQMTYGADIVICLDDCTHAGAPASEQRVSVDRTVAWARRCKDEFARQLDQRGWTDDRRPLLFGVVQGGADLDLRRRCADALLDIGFDGYGYGGWPLDSEGRLLEDMLAATRAMIPPEYPMHALGVGHPESVCACAALGYGLFDSALPTRDARQGRLYVHTADPAADRREDAWFDTLYIQDRKHIKRAGPLSLHCDCHTCATCTVGYLHHLFTCNDALYARLSTIHNLRFMTRLTDALRRV